MLAAGLLLSAGSLAAQERSGYLGETYSKLQETKSASGQQIKRWVAPELAAGKFTSLILEPLVLYPEPKATSQVSTATLKEITAYLDQALRRELAGVATLVNEPGPGTLRVKPAITAAAAKDQGLQPYEVIPLAFVFSQAKKAAGTRTKEAFLALEWQAFNAQSGALLGAGMREGTGQKLKEPKDNVTLDHYKPLLDAWAKDARLFFESVKAGK